jgi:hypothetical protein
MGFQPGGAGYWILDTGYWILDIGYTRYLILYLILDTGCWMLDAGLITGRLSAHISEPVFS